MVSKNFLATRWGIISVGGFIGVFAALLQTWGNPGNMGVCVACFERDIAGAIGIHRAGVVQYMRPEIIGFVLGSLIALIALLWKGSPILGLVVGLATFLNLIAAGFAGVLVPLGMSVIKLDPALASPVLVSTLTDTLGYLIYLSIATMLLLGLL